jgi:hypothetical protein
MELPMYSTVFFLEGKFCQPESLSLSISIRKHKRSSCFFHEVCIGLIWDSECPEVTQITQLLDCIDPVLRLPEVSSLFLHTNDYFLYCNGCVFSLAYHLKSLHFSIILQIKH